MSFRIIIDAESKDEFELYTLAAAEAQRIVLLLDDRGFKVKNSLILDVDVRCPHGAQ